MNNLGGGDPPGMEQVWDQLLTAGQRVYGIAVDDAHYFKRPWDPMAPRPGRGWVIVHAPQARGVGADDVARERRLLRLDGRRARGLRRRPAAIDVRVRAAGDTRYRSGSSVRGEVVLDTVDGAAARFALTGRRGYARVVVTDSNGADAWGQPVFLD